jgi:beta-lactam-binding protein with PASTA domain
VPATGIVRVVIDTRNGCLVDEFTPVEYQQLTSFVQGTEPTESCRMPGDATRVPDILRFPLEDALRVLRGNGFAVAQQEERTTTYPPGRVIDVSPAVGTLAATGSTVTITVSTHSRGETAVPDVLGMSRAAAVSVLEGAHFEVRTVTERESEKGPGKRNEGRVWKQSPAGGTPAERGSTVTIWVNPG